MGPHLHHVWTKSNSWRWQQLRCRYISCSAFWSSPPASGTQGPKQGGYSRASAWSCSCRALWKCYQDHQTCLNKDGVQETHYSLLEVSSKISLRIFEINDFEGLQVLVSSSQHPQHFYKIGQMLSILWKQDIVSSKWIPVFPPAVSDAPETIDCYFHITTSCTAEEWQQNVSLSLQVAQIVSQPVPVGTKVIEEVAHAVNQRCSVFCLGLHIFWGDEALPFSRAALWRHRQGNISSWCGEVLLISSHLLEKKPLCKKYPVPWLCAPMLARLCAQAGTCAQEHPVGSPTLPQACFGCIKLAAWQQIALKQTWVYLHQPGDSAVTAWWTYLADG